MGHFDDISEHSGVLATGKRIHRGALFADYNNDGRVDKAYALSTPPLDPRPITWTVTDLDRELRRLANRSVGIAAAL